MVELLRYAFFAMLVVLAGSSLIHLATSQSCAGPDEETTAVCARSTPLGCAMGRGLTGLVFGGQGEALGLVPSCD